MGVPVVRVAVAAELVERQLLQLWQDGVEPAAGLFLAGATVGVAGPVYPQPPEAKCPLVCSKVSMARPICLRLFWHCTPARPQRGLHRRQQERDQDADDRDDHQKFDERETRRSVFSELRLTIDVQ